MRGIFLGLVLLAAGSAAAGAAPVFTAAENSVPVAMTDVTRTPQYTQIQLKTLSAVKQVCWHDAGTLSPYLVAGGQRYHFIGGDGIAICPQGRDYDANAIMVLRFQAIPATVSQLSLVEGQGGENQMIDPNSDPTTRYWNFLRVPLPQ